MGPRFSRPRSIIPTTLRQDDLSGSLSHCAWRTIYFLFFFFFYSFLLWQREFVSGSEAGPIERMSQFECFTISKTFVYLICILPLSFDFELSPNSITKNPRRCAGVARTGSPRVSMGALTMIDRPRSNDGRDVKHDNFNKQLHVRQLRSSRHFYDDPIHRVRKSISTTRNSLSAEALWSKRADAISSSGPPLTLARSRHWHVSSCTYSWNCVMTVNPYISWCSWMPEFTDFHILLDIWLYVFMRSRQLWKSSRKTYTKISTNPDIHEQQLQPNCRALPN